MYFDSPSAHLYLSWGRFTFNIYGFHCEDGEKRVCGVALFSFLIFFHRLFPHSFIPHLMWYNVEWREWGGESVGGMRWWKKTVLYRKERWSFKFSTMRMLLEWCENEAGSDKDEEKRKINWLRSFFFTLNDEWGWEWDEIGGWFFFLFFLYYQRVSQMDFHTYGCVCDIEIWQNSLKRKKEKFWKKASQRIFF